MIIEKRDGGLWADLLWEDLSTKAQKQLLKLMGENGNFDVFPIVSINVSQEEEETDKPRITAKDKDGGWIDGTIDNFRFQAKVYDTGSKFGIENGRVSKLEVWQPEAPFNDRLIYDRGWSKKPESEQDKEILRTLLEYLESLPAEQERKEQPI